MAAGDKRFHTTQEMGCTVGKFFVFQICKAYGSNDFWFDVNNSNTIEIKIEQWLFCEQPNTDVLSNQSEKVIRARTGLFNLRFKTGRFAGIDTQRTHLFGFGQHQKIFPL